MTDHDPIFCDRCMRAMQLGNGEFYVVKIEAMADPTPPTLVELDRDANVTNRLDKLVSNMEDLSPREAMDQVYRQLTIHLCLPCYRDWIENPTGS